VTGKDNAVILRPPLSFRHPEAAERPKDPVTPGAPRCTAELPTLSGSFSGLRPLEDDEKARQAKDPVVSLRFLGAMG